MCLLAGTKTYCSAAGFASQDAAGPLLGHTEVLQVGCVNLFGQRLQVGGTRFAEVKLLCKQARHQLLPLRLRHASVSYR